MKYIVVTLYLQLLPSRFPLELSVNKKINPDKANVTILGDGLVGHAIAETLLGNNYDVTSVDSDNEIYQYEKLN
jgi:hypothetical protein